MTDDAVRKESAALLNIKLFGSENEKFIRDVITALADDKIGNVAKNVQYIESSASWNMSPLGGLVRTVWGKRWGPWLDSSLELRKLDETSDDHEKSIEDYLKPNGMKLVTKAVKSLCGY